MSVYGERLRRLITVTATTYRATKQDLGARIHNRGAGGNLAITLPPTLDLDIGWWVEVFCVAAGTVTVSAPTASTMVVFNNGAASSIAFSTASEIIGSSMTVTWDGTGWQVDVHLAAETVTPVIA